MRLGECLAQGGRLWALQGYSCLRDTLGYSSVHLSFTRPALTPSSLCVLSYVGAAGGTVLSPAVLPAPGKRPDQDKQNRLLSYSSGESA